MSKEKLKKFQDNSLKKIVQYAYNIPLYREKYKEAGIHPEDITGINDIEKLPLISKDDMRKHSPDGIISSTFNKKDRIMSRTGGTTGASLLIYFDLYTVIKGMLGFIRAFKVYSIDWRKTKMSLFLDLSERSFENEYFVNSIFPTIKPIFSQKNIQIYDLFTITPEVVKKIDNFRPEFIAGYPFSMIQLAIFKKKGYGKNINPNCIMTSGSYLDINLRKMIEDTFNTKVYDYYSSTESGPIAFECKNGNYHVLSDLVYPEFIMKGKRVEPGEPGTLVLTKLYGRGTPIIRYTGIDDIVTTEKNDCSCGLSGSLIKSIHGRKNDSILLPNGKMVLPSFMEKILGETLNEAKENKIQRIQIIQHKVDSLEIKILFDEELRNIGTSPEKIFSILKINLENKLGSNFEVSIREVDKFDVKDPYFICKVDRSKFIEKSYLV
jgi:phenylacetate-CoA ligase